jgi:SAM-dependent methyltransferase
MFNALAAPLIFPWLVEYPLMLVAACFFRPASRGGAKRTEFNLRDLEWLLGLIAATMLLMGLSALFFTSESLLLSSLLYAVPALICFGFRKRPLRFALGVTVLFLTVACYVSALFGDVLLTERNFYGMKRVSRVEDQYHSLVNGNIVHGIQKMRPRPSSEPLGYYCRSGPLGDLTCAFDRSKEKGRVAVVGLGTGSIASYARPGQHYTFYEIDPAVIRIAKDPKLFTYLTECRGAWDVVEGDARLRMAEAPDGEFHAIILDAFSSDSIPMHLLTQEALQLYCRKLKADGVLVFHISNRYLNLEPVLAALAEKNHLVCFSRADLQVPEEERSKKKYPSHYLVMARHLSDLGGLSKNSHWSRPKPLAGAQEWTDDYSNILSVLDW